MWSVGKQSGGKLAWLIGHKLLVFLKELWFHSKLATMLGAVEKKASPVT